MLSVNMQPVILALITPLFPLVIRTPAQFVALLFVKVVLIILMLNILGTDVPVVVTCIPPALVALLPVKIESVILALELSIYIAPPLLFAVLLLKLELVISSLSL
ncbi:hypothetical protein MBCUT_01750 [Methanobrevibacter cuticularis]|uniref:Uncharacterized protein n=1 Tax=Methanobrevibacter cuticularis TaxID=47311 RepID=A0A166FDP5_9EURY|nr:hypothetical protein MBCUT_01750 [Methanobrevibacter cuticularis]